MKYCFGDIVVVNGDEIGVIVKCWQRNAKGVPPTYDVYCRMSDTIDEFKEAEIRRYMVRHKYLDEQELQWNNNANEH